MSTPLVIAISGASGSGKSLFTENLLKEFSDDGKPVQILREDHYYRSQDHLPMSEREKNNYDHPKAFEHELLVEHLEALKNWKAIEYPHYCYKTHTRLEQTEHLISAPVIIIEGIMLLANEALQPLFDIKIFVDTPLDICLLRRMKRDIAERGRTLESVANQYESTVKPMYHQFISPSRFTADVIVTQGGKNRIALDVIKSHIQQSLL
ncbi:uridine kinase [Paraglaciecola arctica]|jgi:uridine kinase|uniref:Uridine kinase n=1 Tax=Paraglaciecola arctica BSs20135 TaxID=493475 RepID=K6Y9D4_9ALTE|nr:uridine kinase [Paraglaciecola arctica]GAC20576.1 uridine kinase [Paraglaciecola arctica BSs20135]|tara:strand:+ start:220 stop:843 length:624 start_codon:yes stop_codon:yes gene_type:complete